jgi:hypothetical protein
VKKNSKAPVVVLMPLSIATRASKQMSQESDPGSPRESKRRWTKDEDARLREGVKACGPKSWKKVSTDYLGDLRSEVQCLHRWTKVLKPGLVKGPWTDEEDAIILSCIDRGMTKWSDIANCVPGRLGKQCRERWSNHLDPNLKKGHWSVEEDRLLVEAQSVLGNCWSRISKVIQGRSENSIKNRWNSAVRKQRQDENQAILVASNSEEIKNRILELANTSEDNEVPVLRGYLSPRGGGNESMLAGHTREVGKRGNNRRLTGTGTLTAQRKHEDFLCSKFVRQEEQMRKAGLSKRERQLFKEAFVIGLRHNQQCAVIQQEWHKEIGIAPHSVPQSKTAEPVLIKPTGSGAKELHQLLSPSHVRVDTQPSGQGEEGPQVTPKQRKRPDLDALTSVEPEQKRQRTCPENGWYGAVFNLKQLPNLPNLADTPPIKHLSLMPSTPLKLKLNISSFRPNGSATNLTAYSNSTFGEPAAVASPSSEATEDTVVMQAFSWVEEAELVPLDL